MLEDGHFQALMHLAQQIDDLARPMPLRPGREGDEIDEEHGAVLLAHLGKCRVAPRQAVDGGGREVAREVGALALQRRLPEDEAARAPDDQRQQRRDDEEDGHVLHPGVEVDEGVRHDVADMLFSHLAHFRHEHRVGQRHEPGDADGPAERARLRRPTAPAAGGS